MIGYKIATEALSPLALHKQILNAMSAMAFLVDEDVRVLDANAAAVEGLGNDFEKIKNKRGGDLLNCTSAVKSAEGCGRSRMCELCPIRNSVKEAFRGNQTAQTRAKMELATEKGPEERFFLITAVPIEEGPHKRVLLMFEDTRNLLKIIGLDGIEEQVPKA